MKKFYAIANFIVVVLTIIWNYVANAGLINDSTVGQISHKYGNLLTPAGYAFSIWGLIYLGLTGLSIFLIKRVFFSNKEDDFVLQIGPWLIIANIASMIWLYFWLNEKIGLSVLFMFIILISLIVIIIRTNMERWDAPLPIIAWIWWPIDLYAGWIAIASITNVASYLKLFDLQIFQNELAWTVSMIIVATIINLLMIIFRNMREFAAVAVWAIIAIAVRHWDSIPEIQWTAAVCAAVLLVVISIHGYQNRETNPLNDLFNSGSG